MEKEPGSRRTENSESEEERALARLLKEKGPEDQGARQRLIAWTESQERAVESAEDPHLARIMLDIRKARLYFAAGFREAALDSLEAAKTQAYNERRDDLCDKISKKIEELS